MPANIDRLLGGLQLFAPTQESWYSRRFLRPNRGPGHEDPGFVARAETLRRAFPLADAMSIEALTAISSLMSIPGGVPLIVEGEQADAVYIVVAGVFAAYGQEANEQSASPDRFGPGDVIGDIGFITGEARSATIVARRNSELLRISKPDLRSVTARCPGVMLAFCSGAVQRLQRARPVAVVAPKYRTFCFVPADSTIDARPVIEKIASSLAVFGSVTILSAAEGAGKTSGWFAEIESRFDFILFQAEYSPSGWTRFCHRQSDRSVLLARGDAEAANCPGLNAALSDIPQGASPILLLLWQGAIAPAKTSDWLEAVNPSGHHHIRSSADIARASRLIAGRGLGLVLSGGGAKALAHVGVIDALREHNIQIDAVGGTSIGAIVAAVFALEWDLAATVRSLAMAFNRRRFSDFAVPRTALYSERAFARTLGHCFRDLALEDSPIPLFCVSTNLTAGSSVVHRTGRLATWLRATTAVPGICPPVMEQNAVYVDGGVLNNMPTDAIRHFGVASAIAVDVGSSLEGQARSDGGTDLPNMWDLLWRVGTIGSDTAASRLLREGDIVLKPALGGMGLFEWNSHERAIAAGREIALKHLDEIRAATKPMPQAY